MSLTLALRSDCYMNPDPQQPGLALFDFDGTITYNDTLVPFLGKARGYSHAVRAAVAVGLAACRREWSLKDRDEGKDALLRQILTGMSETEFYERGEQYAKALYPKKFRPEMVARIHAHLDRGDDVAIVSASLATYLRPIAELLEIPTVIGVEMVAHDGLLTGDMRGPNVRGPEKAVKVREWLSVAEDAALPHRDIWAYGNSSGDFELLELAHHRVWFGSEKSRPNQAVLFHEAHFA